MIPAPVVESPGPDCAVPPAGGSMRSRLTLLWADPRRAAAIVAAVAMLVYLGSLWNGFAYDDGAIVATDPRIRAFAFLRIWRLPYWSGSPDLAIYRPLTTLSFALDWAVSHGAPWFFHAMNVLQHGLATALVFFLLANLFTPAGAFLGALVFAVHPVHVEAVANVVGRAEMLSAIFYLAAILLWIRGGSKASPGRVAAVALCFAIALLFKESSATLPAALVLVDAGLGRLKLRWEPLRDYLRRTLPTYLVLAGLLAAFLGLRLAVLGRLAPSVVDPIFDLPMPASGRVITALQTWPVFARLLFFPRTLLADYGPRILMPLPDWTPLSLAGLCLLILLVTGGIDALVRGHGRLALGLLWFPLLMLPVSNLLFPIGIIVAERTLYLPLVALCIGVAAATEWGARLGPAARSRLALLAVLAVAALALRTVTRVPDWASTATIFRALERDRPDSFRAAWYLAREARSEHRPGLEMQRYRNALRIWPYRYGMVLEAVTRAVDDGQTAEARGLAAFAVRRWDHDVGFRRIYAGIALDLRDTLTARAQMNAGLALAPRDTFLLHMAREIGTAPAGGSPGARTVPPPAAPAPAGSAR